MAFDLDSLVSSTAAMLKLVMFVGAVPGGARASPRCCSTAAFSTPRDRAALAFYSATELPLVVAITTIAVQEGHMRSSTAAGLVGAAIISALAFPLVALKIRSTADKSADPEVPGSPASASA